MAAQIDHIERHKKFLFILAYGIRAGSRKDAGDYSEARVFLNSPPKWSFSDGSVMSPLWPSGAMSIGLLRRIYKVTHD